MKARIEHYHISIKTQNKNTIVFHNPFLKDKIGDTNDIEKCLLSMFTSQNVKTNNITNVVIDTEHIPTYNRKQGFINIESSGSDDMQMLAKLYRQDKVAIYSNDSEYYTLTLPVGVIHNFRALEASILYTVVNNLLQMIEQIEKQKAHLSVEETDIKLLILDLFAYLYEQRPLATYKGIIDNNITKDKYIVHVSDVVKESDKFYKTFVDYGTGKKDKDIGFVLNLLLGNMLLTHNHMEYLIEYMIKYTPHYIDEIKKSLMLIKEDIEYMYGNMDEHIEHILQKGYASYLVMLSSYESWLFVFVFKMLLYNLGGYHLDAAKCDTYLTMLMEKKLMSIIGSMLPQEIIKHSVQTLGGDRNYVWNHIAGCQLFITFLHNAYHFRKSNSMGSLYQLKKQALKKHKERILTVKDILGRVKDSPERGWVWTRISLAYQIPYGSLYYLVFRHNMKKIRIPELDYAIKYAMIASEWVALNKLFKVPVVKPSKIASDNMDTKKKRKVVDIRTIKEPAIRAQIKQFLINDPTVIKIDEYHYVIPRRSRAKKDIVLFMYRAGYRDAEIANFIQVQKDIINKYYIWKLFKEEKYMMDAEFFKIMELLHKKIKCLLNVLYNTEEGRLKKDRVYEILNKVVSRLVLWRLGDEQTFKTITKLYTPNKIKFLVLYHLLSNDLEEQVQMLKPIVLRMPYLLEQVYGISEEDRQMLLKIMKQCDLS